MRKLAKSQIGRTMKNRKPQKHLLDGRLAGTSLSDEQFMSGICPVLKLGTWLEVALALQAQLAQAQAPQHLRGH